MEDLGMTGHGRDGTGTGEVEVEMGKCLKENPKDKNRPLCYDSGKNIDICENKGCDGCCGSHCSWTKNYCED
jgi:hypothetical protein